MLALIGDRQGLVCHDMGGHLQQRAMAAGPGAQYGLGVSDRNPVAAGQHARGLLNHQPEPQPCVQLGDRVAADAHSQAGASSAALYHGDLDQAAHPVTVEGLER